MNVRSILVLLEVPLPMRMTAEPYRITIIVAHCLEFLELLTLEPIARRVDIIQITCSLREEEVGDDKATLVAVLLEFRFQPRDVVVEIGCTKVPTLHTEE